MENRFGIKDLFLFLLLAGLIVVVVLAMTQFDRQYQQVLTIKQQNDELTRDIVGIKRQLAEGVTAVATANGATRPAGPKVDAFFHLRKAEQRPDFARGDWLIENFGTKLGKLTPLIATDIYQRWVESQVLEGMVDRDPYTLEYVPRLASRWDVSEDGLRMTFYLRRGVEFSDGRPLTADDVVFTFNWIRNPAVNAQRSRAYMDKLKDVRKIDDHTVEFTFTEFYYLNFETAGGNGIMPAHFYGRYTPDQFNEKTGLLMGSGPYKLENPDSWTPGQQVVIVRNVRYWGVPPTFNRIVFKEVQGEATEMVLYGNQEHDVIRPLPDPYVKLTTDPRVMAFSNAMEYDDIYRGYTYVAWNQVRKRDGQDATTLFADKRVRQAMTLMLDRERVAKEIWLGYATVATGPFSPNGKQADQTVKPWPYDPARGKALLAEAGFADRNGDGVIDLPDGKPFRFTLIYPSGNETVEKMVLLMKDNFTRGGVIMEPERVDWPVLVNKLNLSDFEAVTLGFSSSPESDPHQVFHSSQIAGQGDNRTSYTNPELDAVIEKARTTVSEDERMKLWNQVHRILHEDQPYTFMLNRKALRLFNNRINNIERAKIGLNFEYLNGGMIPWYVPSGQQKYTQ
jgi:peptide/nickel transport system substrate-binding protein